MLMFSYVTIPPVVVSIQNGMFQLILLQHILFAPLCKLQQQSCEATWKRMLLQNAQIPLSFTNPTKKPQDQMTLERNDKRCK